MKNKKNSNRKNKKNSNPNVKNKKNSNSNLDSYQMGATAIFTHIRDGEVINIEIVCNKFPDEALVYALNVAFSKSVAAGSPPTPFNNFYLGLGEANRSFTATDRADNSATHPTGAGNGIHALATEFETYTEGTRPEWIPQILGDHGLIELSNVGAEAVYTVGAVGSVDINSAFLITANDKTGASDISTTRLCSGFKFAAPRTLIDNDVFKVGYILRTQSIT